MLALVPVFGAKKAVKFPAILIKSIFDLLLLGGSAIVVHALLTNFVDDYIIDPTNLHVPSLIIVVVLTLILWSVLRMAVLGNKGGKK